MRLDYALYGLGVVLFALTAVFFVLIPENEGQLVYVVSTAVLGALSIGTGFVQRPKPTIVAAPQETLTSAPLAEPDPVVAAPVVEEQVAPVVVAPIELAPVSLPAVEAPPALQIPEESIETAPTPNDAVSTVPEARSELTQIRGINGNRAEQLRANGISSIRDLANASPEELASKLSVSPKIVKMWVGSAKKLAK